MTDISTERDGPTDLPLVRMTAGETRMLGMDVSDRMEDGDDIDSITSVAATKLQRISSSANLTLASAAADGQTIEFLASGGTAGETYRVRATWVVDSETLIADMAVAVES